MKTANRLTINREIALEQGWAHLLPLGEYRGVMTDAEGEHDVRQVFDAAVLAEIVRNFAPRVLVDFEHRSEMPDGDTSAAAWIMELTQRDDGLWGRLDLSDLGQAAIENKRYRHLSPLLEVRPDTAQADIVRPVRLVSAAFTNRPNLRSLNPLFNRDPQNPAEAPQAGKESMKEIIALLGLAEDADPAAVQAAVQALKDEVAALKAKLAEGEAAALDAEAEEFVAANKDRIADPAAVKKEYVANKDATKALFGALAKPAAKPAVVLNRAAAKSPAAGAKPDDAKTSQRLYIQQVRNREKCDHKTAFNMARAEKPELFQEVSAD